MTLQLSPYFTGLAGTRFEPEQGALPFPGVILSKRGITMTRSSPHWAIICIYAAGAAIAITLIVQHWVHIPAILPWLLFLACPLMHLLMHRGHSRHHH